MVQTGNMFSRSLLLVVSLLLAVLITDRRVAFT